MCKVFTLKSSKASHHTSIWIETRMNPKRYLLLGEVQKLVWIGGRDNMYSDLYLLDSVQCEQSLHISVLTPDCWLWLGAERNVNSIFL